MQRVQAGGDLHPLGLVHGVPVGQVDAGLLQRRAAVGELVLHYQVLRALGVDEGRNVGVPGGDDGRHALDAVFGQRFLHHLVGAGGDLVDHGPGEGDLALVLEVIQEVLPHKALLLPGFGHRHHAGLQLLAVMGAVVHADHGQRRGARAEPLIQQGGHHAHGVAGVFGAFVHVGLDDRHQAAVGAVEGVALLGDGEGDHLQAGVGEDLFETGHHGGVGGIGAQGLGHRTDDLAAGGAVGVQRDHHGQVVIGGVDLVDDVVVEGVRRDDAAVGQPLVEQPLLQRRDEPAENVARAEMHPHRVGFGGGGHGGVVESGQPDAQFLPFRLLPHEGSCIHLHDKIAPFV